MTVKLAHSAALENASGPFLMSVFMNLSTNLLLAFPMETNFVHTGGAEVGLAVLGHLEGYLECKWLSWLTVLIIAV